MGIKRTVSIRQIDPWDRKLLDRKKILPKNAKKLKYQFSLCIFSESLCKMWDFKNRYATNGSPWWDTSIASSNFFGQFRHHLELAPEQIILQGTLIQNTKEIFVYQFFWIYFYNLFPRKKLRSICLIDTVLLILILT